MGANDQIVERPIGVFDSGIGGLTVVRAMLEAMPHESMIYLGDTARVPYGVRSPETVIRYSLEGLGFLGSRGIKMLVVACNTMSAIALDAIRGHIDVPVIGVIVPGARAAVSTSSRGKIGVIGTEATIRSGAYLSEIKALDPSAEVISTPCPLFVPLVEEGWLGGDVPRLVAEEYLGGMKTKGIDTLLLGCTHYPLLKAVISDVMGDGIQLIDSAYETAKQVREKLACEGLVRTAGAETEGEFFVTDSAEKFRIVGERFLGRNIERIEKVGLEVA